MSAKLPVIRKQRALNDLASQAEYIARNQPAAAIRLVEQFDSTIEHLRVMPRLGRVLSERSRRLAGVRYIRVLGFRNFLIIYRVNPASIEVLRLLHGARDLTRTLRTQEE